MPKRILIRAAKSIAVLLLSALTGIVGLLGWLWLDHGRETLLPKPTGAYQVGRVIYDWTGESRLNPYAPAAGAKQELAVWVWYPATVTRPPTLRNIFRNIGEVEATMPHCSG